MAKKIKTTEEPVEKSSVRDELSTIITKNLGKQFKDLEQAVWFLDEPEDAPTNVSDWISTGSTILDLAISNRPNGGYPVGKIVEITGLEGTGKSLLAAHAIAETQKRGGIGVFIDTESAVSPEFFTAIGVDTKNMLYIPAETTEYIFEAMENIITSVRSGGDSKRLVTIVVDSLAGASTEVEMDADYKKDGWATAKAIILSKAMRKITNLIAKEKILVILTNQLRQKLNAMAFADPWTTSGGKAVAFHSSIRVRLASKGKIKKNDDVVGMKIEAKIVKNRIGPPFRSAEIDMYFDSGIDHYSDWLTALKNRKLITQSGANMTYETVDETTGEVTESPKFTSKEFPALVEGSEKVKAELYKKLCDACIMEYRKAGVSRLDEDVEIDEGVVEE